MFSGIKSERIRQMTPKEQRLLDNVKKSILESDRSIEFGEPEDKCLPALFAGLDTAKTLRNLLLGIENTHRDNRKRFLEFLALSIPIARDDSRRVNLTTADGQVKPYHFGEIVYEIRCKLHENENLDVREDVDFHILVDWESSLSTVFARQTPSALIVSGYFVWQQLRMLLAKFVTSIDSEISFHKHGAFNITCVPDIGSIYPERRRRKEELN